MVTDMKMSACEDEHGDDDAQFKPGGPEIYARTERLTILCPITFVWPHQERGQPVSIAITVAPVAAP